MSGGAAPRQPELARAPPFPAGFNANHANGAGNAAGNGRAGTGTSGQQSTQGDQAPPLSGFGALGQGWFAAGAQSNGVGQWTFRASGLSRAEPFPPGYKTGNATAPRKATDAGRAGSEGAGASSVQSGQGGGSTPEVRLPKAANAPRKGISAAGVKEKGAEGQTKDGSATGSQEQQSGASGAKLPEAKAPGQGWYDTGVQGGWFSAGVPAANPKSKASSGVGSRGTPAGSVSGGGKPAAGQNPKPKGQDWRGFFFKAGSGAAHPAAPPPSSASGEPAIWASGRGAKRGGAGSEAAQPAPAASNKTGAQLLQSYLSTGYRRRTCCIGTLIQNLLKYKCVYRIGVWFCPHSVPRLVGQGGPLCRLQIPVCPLSDKCRKSLH